MLLRPPLYIEKDNLFIHVYLYIRMKRKLTLSIDEDVIKKAKSALALKNITLSGFVESI
jgi:hypothetical protein